MACAISKLKIFVKLIILFALVPVIFVWLCKNDACYAEERPVKVLHFIAVATL
jgi:hypothetical protein